MDQKPTMIGHWLFCKRCKKKLMKRMPNGLFVFEFGKKRGDTTVAPRVHIEVDGDTKIRCLNPECIQDNVFTKFPRSTSQ
jgi:hypothetical protein